MKVGLYFKRRKPVKDKKLPIFNHSLSRMFSGAFKSFAKVTEIRMCQNLFFNKVVSLSPSTKKRDFGTETLTHNSI